MLDSARITDLGPAALIGLLLGLDCERGETVRLFEAVGAHLTIIEPRTERDTK